MNRKTAVFGIIALIILIGSVVVGTLLVRQNQDFRERAAPATSLTISPSTQNKAPNENVTFEVVMNTGTNLVTGVDLRMTFDPSVLEITSITKGSGIVNLDATIANVFNNNAGTISFAVYTVDKSKAVNGSSLQALVVNAKVKSGAPSGVTRINFESTTSIAGVDEGQNVLTNASSGNINVTSGSAGSGATATATGTAVATATATNSGIGGGAGGTSTATATATSTAKSSVTATPTGINGSGTATPFPVPETGFDIPTILGIGVGMLVVFTSLFLAL